MKVNTTRLQIALATACMNPYDICKAVDVNYQTYRRLASGLSCKPATVGKIARALGCEVTELLDDPKE